MHGQKLAALCVMDERPRDGFDTDLCDRLVDLAGVAGTLLELKREAAVRDRIASELMREKWRHALTLEAGKVGSWTFNLVTGKVSGNDMLRQMYGLPPGASMRIDDLLAGTEPDDIETFNAALQQSVTQDADFAVEFRLLSGRRLSARGRVYERDASGQPRVMMGITIDMTEAREAAEHTRHLLLELNHRVKNTLAMTQSIARQTMRQKPDPLEFIDSFSGRIRTLADAHSLLADRDWAGVGLVELVQSQVEPYALAAGDRLTVSGADAQLPPDHALGLGIILHELASNAARHGALSGETGQVAVGWEIADGTLTLDWLEQGGPAVTAAPMIGLGSRLIHRSLDKILGSQVRLDFMPDGVQAQIRLPLS
ncbi:MAG: HWE histidine kinase domain-containing protein [Devosia sp.]